MSIEKTEETKEKGIEVSRTNEVRISWRHVHNSYRWIQAIIRDGELTTLDLINKDLVASDINRCIEFLQAIKQAMDETKSK